jgi:ATP-dependent Clp protease protease subunit
VPEDWLQSRLLEQRRIFVNGRLDQPLALRAAAELMTLDALGTDPIDVYLASSDGTLEAAFILIDTLELSVAPIRTHALGEVGGPVLGALLAGGQRIAAMHARFRLSEPTVHISPGAADVVARGQHLGSLAERLRERVASATGHTVAEVAEAMRQGRYLDAHQALEYGLIDVIEGGRSTATTTSPPWFP